MLIGGLQKLTLIDYPSKVACTVFTVGCNFRCPFCYNAELVLPAKKQSGISEKDFLMFLKERKNFLEAVCICGGEPTMHADLPTFCKKIKELNLAIKLDTNGSNPEMLQKLVDEKLVDNISMDIKATKEKYAEITNSNVGLEKIERSIAIIKSSSLPHEFRTTVVPSLHTKEDVAAIAKWVSSDHYKIQNFQPKEAHVDPKFKEIKPFSEEQFSELKSAITSNEH